MPIREYECEKCGAIQEIIELPKISKSRKSPRCECGQILKRIDFSKNTFKIKQYSLIDGNGNRFA